MKKAFWVAITVGILATVPVVHALAWNGGSGNVGNGKAFGIDGRPVNTGDGFFAACLVLSLVLFLLPVWFLKRHHRPRRILGGTIPFLPFSASFHLGDSGETIGKRRSVLKSERDGELTFRPFSFP